MGVFWLSSLGGAGLAVAMSSWWFLLKQDPVLPCPLQSVVDFGLPQCAWSSSYQEARGRFFLATRNATFVDSLPVADDLFIDVAVYKGRPDELVLHISGTHGVEAYVGSAIQISAAPHLHPSSAKPTVILVHALNAFGFSNSRRVNENNVDLNRNAMFGDQAARQRDPNIAGAVLFK